MNLVRRKGQVVYEDLLRELELVEQQLMGENSAIAMSVMVLEAKLRDRFHQMEAAQASADNLLIRDALTVADLETLIPRDLPMFSESPMQVRMSKPRTWETVGMAALLAIATACGVFGLATALQIVLGWMA